jgi:hypothetical protein
MKSQQMKVEQKLSDNLLISLEDKDKLDLHSEPWITSYIVDRLKRHLATIDLKNTGGDTKRVFDSRKYYNQAHDYLKIGAFKPVPSFPVHISDLSPKLVRELSQLNREDRKFVLKQAVGRIFEDINSGLYHDSVSRVLEVKLVE